jgi:hypothetical protein
MKAYPEQASEHDKKQNDVSDERDGDVRFAALDVGQHASVLRR